jgi:hypothetical protein
MKVTNNFSIQELVDKIVITARGSSSIQLIDIRIVRVAQWLRDFTGDEIVVNNWNTGGQYHESGLRDPFTKTGAKFSQHKFGRALDLKFKNTKPEVVRQIIRDNWEELKALGLTTIEKDTPTWVHIDCRYTGMDELYECPYL